MNLIIGKLYFNLNKSYLKKKKRKYRNVCLVVEGFERGNVYYFWVFIWFLEGKYEWVNLIFYFKVIDKLYLSY